MCQSFSRSKWRSFWKVEGQNSLFGIGLELFEPPVVAKCGIQLEVLETFCSLSRTNSDVHLTFRNNMKQHLITLVISCNQTLVIKHLSSTRHSSLKFLSQRDLALMFVAAIEELSMQSIHHFECCNVLHVLKFAEHSQTLSNCQLHPITTKLEQQNVVRNTPAVLA